MGQYLFAKHGGKIIFFGRFIAVLRALEAVLAGANRYPWGRFFAFNAAGGIVWATLYGSAALRLCIPTPLWSLDPLCRRPRWALPRR